MEPVPNVERQALRWDVRVNDIRWIGLNFQHVVREQFADAKLSVVRTDVDEAERENRWTRVIAEGPLFDRGVSEQAVFGDDHIRVFRSKCVEVHGKVDRRTLKDGTIREETLQIVDVLRDHRTYEQIERFDFFIPRKERDIRHAVVISFVNDDISPGTPACTTHGKITASMRRKLFSIRSSRNRRRSAPSLNVCSFSFPRLIIPFRLPIEPERILTRQC